MKQPSSKINALLIIVTLVVVGTISINSIKNHKKDSSFQLAPAVINSVEIQRNQINKTEDDTDGDGLPDWEEIIRKTDPTNPDTDGDRTNDGDEVKENRNPLLAGPDDKIETGTGVTADPSDDIRYKSTTLTEKLSENIITNYLGFKQSNQYTPEVGTELVDAISNDIQKLTQQSSPYTTLSLKTFSFSPDNAKIYGNSFASLQEDFTNNLINIPKEQNSIEYLQNVSKNYIEFSKNLMSIRAPQELASTHVKIANNLYNIGLSIIEINKSEEDPTVALIAVKKFQDIETEQPTLYDKVKQYFEKNDIIFTNTDTGYILWNY